MNHIYCDGGTWDKQFVAMGRKSQSVRITILPRIWSTDSDLVSEVYEATPRSIQHNLYGNCQIYTFVQANRQAVTPVQIIRKSSDQYS